jgi:hypothetical protein
LFLCRRALSRTKLKFFFNIENEIKIRIKKKNILAFSLQNERKIQIYVEQDEAVVYERITELMDLQLPTIYKTVPMNGENGFVGAVLKEFIDGVSVEHGVDGLSFAQVRVLFTSLKDHLCFACRRPISQRQ